jgi:hypothetical protein
MTNAITGLLGMAMFLAFIGGLAESIGAAPFVAIVVIIGSMALYDYCESIRAERQNAAAKTPQPNQEP